MVNPPAGWKKGEPLPAPPQQLSSSALPITTVVEVRRPDETLGDSNFDAVDDLLSDAPPKVRAPSSVSVAPDAPGLARPRFVGAPPPASGQASQTAAARVGEVSPTSATPPTALAAPSVGEGPGTKGKPAADLPSKKICASAGHRRRRGAGLRRNTQAATAGRSQHGGSRFHRPAAARLVAAKAVALLGDDGRLGSRGNRAGAGGRRRHDPVLPR